MIEDYLVQFDGKFEYELYQEPVELATTSEVLFRMIIKNIEFFSIDNSKNISLYDNNDSDTKYGETLYGIAKLDRNVLIPYLERYSDIFPFEITHPKTRYSITNKI